MLDLLPIRARLAVMRRNTTHLDLTDDDLDAALLRDVDALMREIEDLRRMDAERITALVTLEQENTRLRAEGKKL